MLHNIYAALKKRLVERLDQVQPRYVDFYAGQYLEEDQEEGGQLLWGTPAVFIEFRPILWETLSNKVQRADLVFLVHLVNESYYDDDKRVLDPALRHFFQETEVFRALMNWRCNLSYAPGFDALADTDSDVVLLESIVRRSSEPDHAMRRQLVSVQEFACKIYDYSATPKWVEIAADVNLEFCFYEPPNGLGTVDNKLWSTSDDQYWNAD